MTKKIFVTGTGTSVGKTCVTRAITRALANTGATVVPLKPVETGINDVLGVKKPRDAAMLKDACKSCGSVEDICCYMFKDPVSPHLAARNEGKRIDVDTLVKFLNKRDGEVDFLIAEGAGGLLVPLTENDLYADVIKKSGFELLVVAMDALGSISNALLTIEAARRREIPVLGFVLNMGPQEHLGNAEAIAEHCGVPFLGYFPKTVKDEESLAQAAVKHLHMTGIVGDIDFEEDLPEDPVA